MNAATRAKDSKGSEVRPSGRGINGGISAGDLTCVGDGADVGLFKLFSTSSLLLTKVKKAPCLPLTPQGGTAKATDSATVGG